MSNVPTGKIEFIQYHQPGLKAGDYEIKVEQTLKHSKITSNNCFSQTRQCSVSGERFSLNPLDIHAVFPPEGSLGDHFDVLPHLVLKRSTLPWERTINPENKTSPWMVLLLFNEAERPEPRVMTLKELKNTSGYAAKFPGFELETGQLEDDNVTVIDVPQKLLQALLPTPQDLEFTAHVRQGKDEKGNPEGEELAVVLGNRLPKRGETGTVHLVSLENRYEKGAFDFQGAGGDDLIRLVSLKSWKFTCLDSKQSFRGLLEHLDANTFRLPISENTGAENYLSLGCVPCPHYIRQGSQTVSWYHGPFIPFKNETTLGEAGICLPVRAADELLRYDPGTGMFDVSYAAAWELGRLLALQSKSFSVSLFNWKRTLFQIQIQQEQEKKAVDTLPVRWTRIRGTMPETVRSGFRRLALLENVPFNYLVPDERILPMESIRYFYLDPLWMACLFDGVFSIGRIRKIDRDRDKNCMKDRENNPRKYLYRSITGFLLRSDVVSGWPDLQVDAYDEIIGDEDFVPDKEKLKLLRMDRLSKNVLICLFKKEIKIVDIHQKPEALHFGFDTTEDTPPTYYKELKNSAGQETCKKIESIPWIDEGKKVIDINGMADKIKEAIDFKEGFTSAQFALEMIEGVEKVRFVKR